MNVQALQNRRETLAEVKKCLVDCLPLLDRLGASVAGAHIDAAINALAKELDVELEK